MAANEGLASGNEKHICTILNCGPRNQGEIRREIAQARSDDLIVMAFCLVHRQMVDRFKVICVSTNIKQDILAALGYILLIPYRILWEKLFPGLGKMLGLE